MLHTQDQDSIQKSISAHCLRLRTACTLPSNSRAIRMINNHNLHVFVNYHFSRNAKHKSIYEIAMSPTAIHFISVANVNSEFVFSLSLSRFLSSLIWFVHSVPLYCIYLLRLTNNNKSSFLLLINSRFIHSEIAHMKASHTQQLKWK